MMSSKRSFLSCGICKRSPSGKRATDQEGDNLDPKCSQTSSSTECLTDSYPAPGKSSTTHEVPDPINTPTAGSTQDDVNDKGSSSIEAGRKQATGTPNSLRGQQQLHLLKRRSSASLLQTVLRRKMSRESHLSQSSKRDSQISWTEEDIERHVERRKALESRLRDDLIASGKLEERSRVENTDMLDTPSQRSKSPSLANTVGMISPQACDGSFDGRPEHPARPGIKERSQDSELQIAAGNVLKEVRRAQEGEDEREPIPEKEQILEKYISIFEMFFYNVADYAIVYKSVVRFLPAKTSRGSNMATHWNDPTLREASKASASCPQQPADYHACPESASMCQLTGDCRSVRANGAACIIDQQSYEIAMATSSRMRNQRHVTNRASARQIWIRLRISLNLQRARTMLMS